MVSLLLQILAYNISIVTVIFLLKKAVNDDISWLRFTILTLLILLIVILITPDLVFRSYWSH